MRHKQSYKRRMKSRYYVDHDDSSDEEYYSKKKQSPFTSKKNNDSSDSSDSSSSSSSSSSENEIKSKKTRTKRKDDYSSDSDDDSLEDDSMEEKANRYNTPITNKQIINNENLSDQEKIMIRLFNLVFGNMVLTKQIFHYSRLYKKNESQIKFKTLSSLREYPEKEYLRSIIYKGYEKLNYGDLQFNSISFNELEISEDVINSYEHIPYGVEILLLRSRSSNIGINDLSKLPSTIHTMSGVPITIINGYIPNHITTISFLGDPNLSNPNDANYIILPNTIRNLKLYKCTQQEQVIRPGDIPIGVTSFEGDVIDNNNFNCLPEGLTNLKIDRYSLQQVSKLVLPNSLKHLSIRCFQTNSGFPDFTKKDYSNGLFNFIPPNLESLEFYGDIKITVNSNLSTKGASIKRLNIQFDSYSSINHMVNNSETIIEPNSLPPNVVELHISSYTGTLYQNIIPNKVVKLSMYHSCAGQFTISKHSIPNSVKSLTLHEPITSSSNFPKSLTDLHIRENFNISISDKSIQKMIDILPRSLTSITLPIKFKQYHKDIPKRIEIINNNNR